MSAQTAPPVSSDPRGAWAPYEPGAGRPWNLALAAHLLRRAGFGAAWSRLQQALADGPQRTVDRLLAPPPETELFEREISALEAPLARSETAGSGDCAAMWLYRMLQTPHPLAEKMTLFWHDHFAVAGARVGRALLIQRHLSLLRRHALGRFDALLRDVCRDPATMIALDARANRRAQPAGKFAATLLGRYTLGPGAFTAGDVRETARAFTGSSVLGGEYRYLAREHDDGTKTILGRQGNFSGEDVPALLLAHPATPRRVVRRLYRWLISETSEPGDALLAPLVEAFALDYDIGKLAGTMLRSNLFFSASAYRQRVKSPVEFALGIAAAFEAPLAPAPLHQQLAALGQRLLEPPTRDGWAGGRRWLNRFTIVARASLAESLLSSGRLDPRALAAKYGYADPTASARFLADLLVAGDPPRTAPVRELAQAILASPEYQLA